MNQALIDLFAAGDTWILQACLVFVRVGPLMAVLPAFGEQSVPMRIKLGLAMAFTAIVFAAVPPIDHAWMQAPVHYLLAESVIGLALGISLRMFVFALQTAGSIAAQATSLAQIFGGAASEPMPAIGHVLVIAGLALAVMFGLHVRISEFLIYSYQVFPHGEFPRPGIISDWGVGQVVRAFSLAFTLAAPFVIMSVVYNLTLGVINRAMPQLMVAFVGAPVITAGGLIFLFLLAPMMLGIWHQAFSAFLANPIGSIP